MHRLHVWRILMRHTQGGKILAGGKVLPGDGNFVEPTIVAINHDAPIVKTELFVPILYVIKCKVLLCCSQ
jgi:aldehyde dehydrogenase family 7 protein A1